jgi:STE24 endopeptidase
LRVREILVWNTGGLVINAAVAGVVPGLRYVFLTDGLLEHLRDDEIQAVFGHEIGHIRHGHLFLRGFALLAPLSLWLLARQAIPQFGDWVEEWYLSGGSLWQAHAALFGLAGMCFYMLVFFGPFCRLLEGQADLYGCRTLADEPTAQPVETFVSALECLALASGTDRRTGNWQHWSIARRVHFLNCVAQQPAQERLFRRRLHLIHGLLLAVILSPLVYQVFW